MQRNKKRGSALLTALFIMTLVAIVATAMSAKVQIDIYRTKLIVLHDRLYLASQAVAIWAISELNDNEKKFSKADDAGMVSKYPEKFATIYPAVQLSGGLYDLQSQYNINNLLNKKYLIGFTNMLKLSKIQASATEKINMTFAINDWLSPFDLARGKDLYLSYYLNLKPPYHPSHQLMSSRSELRLVKDIDAKLDQALQPLIAALPEQTALNLNTAPKQIIMSLSNLMEEKHADKIIDARGEKGMKSIEKIQELLKKLNITNDQITLESAYYLSVAHAKSDNNHLTVYTLFKRNRDKKGKITVSVLRQSFNVF